MPPLADAPAAGGRAPEAGARGWRPAPSATSVLLACGWLRPADLADPRLRIEFAASSHELVRVTAPDRRCVVVKQVPAHAAARQRSLMSEMFVYRLARWLPEVARAVPHPVYIDEGRHVIVLDALATGAGWPAPAALAPVSSPAVGRQVGTLLAGVHRATADMAMWPSPAMGVLGLPSCLEEASRDRPATTGALMRAIAEDGALAALLAAGAAAYRARCVIHGDLRQQNWLIDDRAPGAALKLLDWELAGSGDPAWDFGSLVAEAVFDEIRRAPPRADATCLPEALAAPVGAALSAYFGSATLLDPDRDDTWEKLARYAAARLLHAACECCDQGSGHGAWPASALVGAARAIAHDPAATAQQLRSWGGA